MLDEMSRDPIGVLIVEDDAVTRRCLSLAIESEPALKLLGTCDSVKSALEWLETEPVEVLLTDLGLPDGSGLEIIRACAQHRPNCDIMVVTISSDQAQVLACIEAGASGYVLKDDGRTHLVGRAVLDLCAGGAPMSPAIARMVLAKVRDGKKATATKAAESSGPIKLTQREASILELMAQGDSYGEVSKRLAVSVGTVQTHIKNIYGKLSVHSRGEAVFEAHRRGLLHIGPAKLKR